MTSPPQGKSELVTFKKEQIPAIWKDLQPHIIKSLGPDESLLNILVSLCDGRMQAWASYNDGIEAVLVTSIQTLKRTKFCLLLTMGGVNMDAWVDWLSIVEDWARKEGCSEMRIYGRRGWAKKLGYEIVHTKMKKQL